MRSETSEDMHEAQPYEEDAPVDALKKAEDFLAKLKDKIFYKREKNVNKKRWFLKPPQGIIPYSNFTYGKLIGACTQEGINLCNELKLSRQLKMDKLREKSQSE
ncbi:hypothetical protein H5410_051089 [Solanum commersonii]|uniref:Uncharacterized protein n=1 Tax=Solanum commersonii TaxID=4109 RepID=A0A9J5WZP2_SOLCO|nr:hypothetical protein H5410_051089 [Solanum commersonii]